MGAKSRAVSSRKWRTGKAARELHDHYHALGVLQAEWNIAELQLQRVCWFLMAAGPEVGRAVTNDMGNVARTNLIATIAKECLKDERLMAYFGKIEKLFNRNREDRNFLAHCRVMYVTNARARSSLAIFQQFKADRRFRHTMYVVPVEEIRQVVADVGAMNAFFERFFQFLEKDGAAERLPSLDIPSPPQNLAQRLHSFQPSDVDRPPPSPGKKT